MIEKIINKLLLVVQFLAGVFFTTLFLAHMLRILLRNLIGITWFWIDGFSRLTFIWTIFLGATALYATDDHLVMDFFVAKMKPAAKKRLDFGIHLAFLFLALVIVVYGFLVLKVRMRIPYTHWNVPTGYAYLAAPVCGILMLIFCAYKLWLYSRGRKKDSSQVTELEK
jgi:TRAP-type C4-dicarboxylate transport system permease small subunit